MILTLWLHSQFPNKRRPTIIFSQTLTAHILFDSDRRDVVLPPTDIFFYKEQDSRRQFDMDTPDRDVNIYRGTTFIRNVRV